MKKFEISSAYIGKSNVWEEIDHLLSKNDVRASAALLRNFLEHFSKEVCQSLYAMVEYRGDAQFTLGGLLPNAIARLKKIFKNAKVAAQSWGQTDKFNAISELESKFNKIVSDSQVEMWQLNTAVHYNEWADLQKSDFLPVVVAYKNLVNVITCNKCNSIIFVIPDVGNAEALTCSCGDSHFNLQSKV